MRFLRISIGVAVLCLLGITYSEASRPVHKTITGCVIQGKLYSIYRSTSEPKGNLPAKAYPIVIREKQMKRYEGKKITVRGYLHPGDRFTPDLESIKVLGPCDKESRKAIDETRR